VEHTVHAFDAELRDLSLKIAEMGSFAEQRVADAIDAVVKRDAALAKRIMAADHQIDALQRAIEEKAVVAMARRQPVGPDLREIVGSLRISNDLAHIGNLAQSNARRVLTLADGLASNEPILQIERMAKLVLKQLRDVFHSYVHRDIAQALEVWRNDQEIDALHSSLFRELLTYMMEDTRTITICTQLLFCAKNIERIGDHVTNIAETIYYIVEGRPLLQDRPKADTSSTQGPLELA
jgi:phosphate transport system protein